MPGRKKLKHVERRAPPPCAPQHPTPHSATSGVASLPVSATTSLLVTQRPKRNIIPKKVDTEGISWREEKMIKKALYASLHPNAAINKTIQPGALVNSENSSSSSGSRPASSLGSGSVTSRAGSLVSGGALHRRGLHGKLKHKADRKRVKLKSNLQRLKCDLKLLVSEHKSSSPSDSSTLNAGTSAATPSTSGNSNKSSAYKAQRKFAQGSVPSSPNVTPVKYLHSGGPKVPSPIKYMLKKPPKTEDFLTFLCLRGTPMLPKDMEFFNYCDPDLLRAMNSPSKVSLTSRGGHRGVTRSPGASRAPSPSVCHSESSSSLAGKTGASSSNKGTAKKFVSKSPSRNTLKHCDVTDRSCDQSRTCSPRASLSSTTSALPSSEDSSQDSMFACPASVISDRSDKKVGDNKRIVTDFGGKIPRYAATPAKRQLTESMENMPKHIVKSPRTLKKETGQKLVRKAKAAMVAKQIQMHLESSSREHKPSGRGMLTRRRRDIIEIEKFTEARLESLYSKPPTRSDAAKAAAAASKSSKSGVSSKSAASANSGIRTGAKSSVAHSTRSSSVTSSPSSRAPEAGVTGSRSGNTRRERSISQNSSSNERQTRNTPSKMEARSAQKLGSSGGSSKRTSDVIMTEDETPVKRSRRSLPLDTSSAINTSQATKDDSKPTTPVRVTRNGGSSTPTSVKSEQPEVLSALPRDLDLSSRSLRCSPSRSAALMSEESRSPLRRGSRSPSAQSAQSDSSTGSTGAKRSKLSRRLPMSRLTLKACSFPRPHEPAQQVQAPTYHPSPEQFLDPMEYIQSIRPHAEPYGMCCIVPPEVWKPECCVAQELRFITEIQHLHKMAERWGGNVQQTECIRKHLAAQNIRFDQPVVGGVELDLPALSKAIRQCGGISAVSDDKRKLQKVADILQIPKWAQDRKLCDVYCKYLLSFDTLSSHEKTKLANQVLADKNRGRLNLDCVLKGKSRSLAEFFKLAHSTLVRWFDTQPTVTQVEDEYWRILAEKAEHVAVHCAHVDTKHCGGGFPTKKDSPYSRHGWNFNVLQHNSMSVLKHLGLVSGVTIPELHMGMLYSTNCWCSDPHGLPYISYLHTGGDIIWYCIPKSEEAKFKEVLQRRSPDLIDADSPIWLPVDSIMISPETLVEEGVSVCRIVQKQGEFMVIYPQSFTATICCDYNISESIRFATAEWIATGYHMSLALHESCEPELFSMDRLLIRLARNEKTSPDMLAAILPTLEAIINSEIALRQKVMGAGLKNLEKMRKPDKHDSKRSVDAQARKKRAQGLNTEEEQRCDECKKICYLSMVMNESDGTVYSLEHAYRHIHRKKNIKQFKLLYRYTEKELLAILEGAKEKLQSSTGSKTTLLRKQQI